MTTTRPNRPQPCPPQNTGDHYRRLALLGVIFAVLAVWLLGMWVFAALTAPYNTLEQSQPLVQEVPLEVIPELPETLAASYDLLRARQLDRLEGFAWVDVQDDIAHIPIESAYSLLLDGGFVIRGEEEGAADTSTETDDSADASTDTGSQDDTDTASEESSGSDAEESSEAGSEETDTGDAESNE